MTKDSSWGDCLFNNNSIEITPDREKVLSLIETAEERLTVIRELNERTANFVFEDYYSSITEILHAIVFLEGYKVNNHICLEFYLRDVLKRDDLFRIFDDCRFKRNSLVYYGKRMDFETASKTIDKSILLFKELKKLINEKLFKQ